MYFFGFLERRCPVLDATNNGQVSHPNRTVGSSATYTCSGSDFVFVAGDQVRKCKPDSTWDGEAAVCSGEYFLFTLWPCLIVFIISMSCDSS